MKDQTLRDLIGDIESSEKKKKYYTITKTSNGCVTNIDLVDDYRKVNWLDAIVANIRHYHDNNNIGEIYLQHPNSRRIRSLNFYQEDGVFKILSTYPGDERGCHVFGDVFISSGHDGNYLWNIKTGEFDTFNW